jgi:xylulokinase
LEGVAYSQRDIFTLFTELSIPVKGVRLGGGGARGPLWRRIQANIYNHPCEILTAEEGGAFGSALLAGVGVGCWPNTDAACAQALTVAETVNPNPENVATYDAHYNTFRKLYPALRSLRED